MRTINLKILLGTIILLTPILLASTALAMPVTKIQVRNVDPKPAEPGDTVKLDLLIKNEGDSEGNYVPLQVETVEGVSYRGSTSNFNENFSLCPGCQMIGTIYLKIEGNASSGTYPLDISISDGKSGIVEKATLEVDGTPNVVVSIPNKDSIRIDEIESVNLSLENIGTDTASEVMVDLRNEFISMNPSPIVVKRLRAGEKVTKDISIKVDKNLDAGIQKLYFSLAYKDESELIIKNSSLPLDVSERARLALSDFNVKDLKVSEPTSAIVEVENEGPGDAKRVESHLNCEGANITVEKSYVGQLDEDESVPMVFELTPHKSRIKCELTTKYVDSEVREFSESFSFTAKKEAFPFWIVILALLSVSTIAFYYWRKKGKNETEEI